MRFGLGEVRSEFRYPLFAFCTATHLLAIIHPFPYNRTKLSCEHDLRSDPASNFLECETKRNKGEMTRLRDAPVVKAPLTYASKTLIDYSQL